VYVFLIALFGIQCTSEKVKSKTIVTEPKPIPVVPDPIPQYIDLNFVMGKFAIQEHSHLVRIDAKHADNGNRYMHKTAYQAFQKMFDAAAADGISMKIKSAARNFDYQKGIWERKWNGATLLEGKINAAKTFADPTQRAQAILKYSSMPGSSRHHWGTDIDINAFENSYFENGEGKKVYDWMINNAHKYGYCQPYTKKDENRPNGYEEEKWHWSYLPVANDCMRVVENEMKNELITGFLGSEQAKAIDIYSNYIFGINTACLQDKK